MVKKHNNLWYFIFILLKCHVHSCCIVFKVDLVFLPQILLKLNFMKIITTGDKTSLTNNKAQASLSLQISDLALQVIFITEYMSSGSVKKFLNKTKEIHKSKSTKSWKRW